MAYKWNPEFGCPDGINVRMRALLASGEGPVLHPPRLVYMGSVPDPVLPGPKLFVQRIGMPVPERVERWEVDEGKA